MIKYHTWQHKHKTMVKDELLRKLGTYGTFFVLEKGYYIVMLCILRNILKYIYNC